MSSYSFSEIIIRELLRKDTLSDTVDTVHEWMKLYPTDRETAAVEYACQLSKDFKKTYVGGKCFGTQLLLLALTHVNWRKVADYLLDRFAPPPEKALVLSHAIRIPSMN